MASSLTSGLDIGTQLAGRILNAQLAQKEHERLIEQQQQQKARDEFNQRMDQLATMIQLQNLGARRATEMDNAEIAIGKVAKPEGIVPSTLAEQLFSGGEGIGNWILPTQEERDTRALNLKRREEGITTEAEAARGKTELEQAFELFRRQHQIESVPMGATLGERLGVDPNTRVGSDELTRMLYYTQPSEASGADFVPFTDDQGNVSIVNRTTGQVTARQPGIGRTTRASATEEGGGLTAYQKIEQRRKTQEEDDALNREEYGYSTANREVPGLHDQVRWIGQVLRDKKETTEDGKTVKLTEARERELRAQLKLKQARLRQIYKRKLQLGLITQQQYERMIAVPGADPAARSSAAAAEAPNNGNPY